MNKSIYYTGIGSRKVPSEIESYFHVLGYYFAKKGFILRSGAAQGSDISFESGCDRARGSKEIYLPWKGFEGSHSKLVVKDDKAFELAEAHHPYWHHLKNGTKRLQARNSHQVLGKDLKTPSQFVICFTKGGKGSGGTGQAIRIAKHYGIPVFDAGKHENLESIKQEMKSFIFKLGLSQKQEPEKYQYSKSLSL